MRSALRTTHHPAGAGGQAIGAGVAGPLVAGRQSYARRWLSFSAAATRGRQLAEVVGGEGVPIG